MRAIWKGAVAFGLVNVPVKLYAATGEHSVPLHQVHRDDGGRIRYKKVCSVCGEEVAMNEMAKGYQTDDGQMVVLTDEDLDELPLATEREIAVEEFVPSDQVDPIMLAKTYYLEPERTATKPYALLREALKTTDRMAVVKVALRQRESMAVLRVRDDVICLQTLLWPDEVRAADFPFLDAGVSVRPQELQMAASLVESLAADFDPSAFEDSYQAALEAVIEAKVTTGSTVRVAAPESEEPSDGGEVVDLLSALQRSVEKARSARGEVAPAAQEEDEDEEPARAKARTAPRAGGRAASGKAAAKPAAAKKPATKAASSGSTGTKAGARSSTAKAAKAPTAKAPAAKGSSTKASSAKAAPTKASATGGSARSKAASEETAKRPAARRRAS